MKKTLSRRRFNVPSMGDKTYSYGAIQRNVPDGSGKDFNHVMNHDYMKHFT